MRKVTMRIEYILYLEVADSVANEQIADHLEVISENRDSVNVKDFPEIEDITIIDNGTE